MEQDQNQEENTQNIDLNNAESSAPEEIVVKRVAVTEAAPAPVVPEETKKKSNGMLLGLILCLLLAIGGIGFGIWGMMDGNSRVDSLNAQIKTLQDEKADLAKQISELEEEISDLENGGGENWLETEIEDGVFYLKDEDGDVIAQSEGIEVKEVVECTNSADYAVLECTVKTSEGEGSLLYDAFSESTILDFKAAAE